MVAVAKSINNRPRTLRLQLAILVVCCLCHGRPALGAADAASLSDQYLRVCASV
jgi:hypothetical protein